jgi:dCMP deaminase
MNVLVDVSNKDAQFMELCKAAAALFSTCSRRQYAAFIVSEDNRVLSMGYNGVPSGFVHCKDGGCPRGSADVKPVHGKDYSNCYASHAEAGALLHSRGIPENSRMYVNGPPCFDCAKLIVNTPIKKVFYLNDRAYPEWEEVQEFFGRASVRTICMGDKSASK